MTTEIEMPLQVGEENMRFRSLVAEILSMTELVFDKLRFNVTAIATKRIESN